MTITDTQPRNTTSSDDPPTLDEGLGNVLFDVWLVSKATHALIDDAVHASGLDADEFAIYSVLSSTDGMTPTDLARWMSAPATTVSSYVKRFEQRGHVRRDPNPDDGRSYRVALTVAGRRVHAEAGELFRPVLDEITRRLGDEVLETHQRLQRLHEATAAMGATDQR